MAETSALRFSIRVSKRVTSISLRKNIVSLWMVLNGETNASKDTMLIMVSDFIYESLDYWNNDTGKGLSDFVSERMIQEILEDEDYQMYRSISALL